MTIHGSRFCTAVLAGLVAAAGCYRYQPLEVPEVAVGQTVRAYVTHEQGARLEDQAGLRDRHLEGRVVSMENGQLLLEVPSAAVSAGAVSRRLKQRVTIPTDQLLELEERTVDPWKTGLVAGGVVAAVGALVAYQLSQGDNSPVRDPKNPPDQLRIPLLSLPLGR